MLHGFPKISSYKAIVQCITYNQSQYIEDTLHGFAIQQTDFPFLCCVYDDASTDGEQEVLKQWVKNHCRIEELKTYDHSLTFILMAPDKENPNCIYVMHLQKVNTWGKPEKEKMMAYWGNQCKYIALCEGDDYWIDPLKLQKQIDFLENNSDYSISHTAYNVYFELNNTFKSKFINSISQPSPEDVLKSYHIRTLTVVFRRDAYEKAIADNHALLSQKFMMGDTQLFFCLMNLGKVHYLNELCGVYRVNNGSATRQNNIKNRYRFSLSRFEMRKYISQHYMLTNEMKLWIDQMYNKALLEYNCFKSDHIPMFDYSFKCSKDYILYFFYKIGAMSIYLHFYELLRFVNRLRKEFFYETN